MYESGDYAGWLAAQPFVILGLYLYFAFCLYAIAKKVGHTSPWWAFIPILNIFQMVQLAGKPWYWFVFLLIPIVNIITMVLIWTEIAKARGKSVAWGVSMVIPLVNYIAVLVLALGQGGQISAPVYQEKKESREPAKVG